MFVADVSVTALRVPSPGILVGTSVAPAIRQCPFTWRSEKTWCPSVLLAPKARIGLPPPNAIEPMGVGGGAVDQRELATGAGDQRGRRPITVRQRVLMLQGIDSSALR